MPYCPNCREEYVEGMSACAECGADLIDGELPDDPESLDDMEPVFYGESSEALIVKTALENRGFHAYIMGEESALPLITAGSDSVSVLVPRDQAEEARDAMEAIRHTEFGEEPMAGKIAGPEEEGAFTEGPYAELGDGSNEPGEEGESAEGGEGETFVEEAEGESEGKSKPTPSSRRRGAPGRPSQKRPPAEAAPAGPETPGPDQKKQASAPKAASARNAEAKTSSRKTSARKQPSARSSGAKSASSRKSTARKSQRKGK